MTAKKQRPALGFNQFYSIKDVKPFPRISATQGFIEWPADTPLLTIGDISLGNNSTEALIKQLLAKCKPSPVGKDWATVFDSKVRNSREIKLKNEMLNPLLLATLNSAVTQMAKTLYHPTKLRISPHKLIIYRQGDHFDQHIDAIHGDGMIMTLSVQIPVAVESEGGLLIIGGEDVGRGEAAVALTPPDENQLWLSLFYHDTVHRVNPVEKGYRLSLTFDVCTEDDGPLVFKPDPLPTTLLQSLHAKGARKIGVMTGRMYLEDTICVGDLKGPDRCYYEQFKASGLKPEIIELVKINRLWMMKEVLELVTMDDAFGCLYHEVEQDDYLGENNHVGLDEKREIINEGQDSLDISKWKVSYKWSCVAKRYLLGDAVFLHYPAVIDPYFIGTDEVHLGNEGFDGDNIMRTWAILCRLPKEKYKGKVSH